tara:strand:+ start:254 stop:511 length:258 start_codon:yes stop_codon:yes gene_type:complete
MIQPTSIAAYNDKDRKKSALSQQIEILKIVKENPELTSSEIGLLTDGIGSPWKRLPELRSKGYVNNPYTRPCGVSGKKAMVWAVA